MVDISPPKKLHMFNIIKIRETILEHNFHLAEETEASISIGLTKDIVLVFRNDLAENDTSIFFENSYWHSHGDILAETYGVSIEQLPTFLLSNLRSGDIFIEKFTYANKAVSYAFIFKDEATRTKYELEPGEEVSFVEVLNTKTSKL